MQKLARYALTIGAAALVSGCGASQSPGAPGVMPASALVTHTTSSNYKVVYSFGTTANDGGWPLAGLIDVGGTLYGTTAGGGSSKCLYYGSFPYGGCGTVFSITPSGTEKVLYSFGPPPDGSIPQGALLDVGGTLYGTTAYGGSDTGCGDPSPGTYGCGTVFTITTSGMEKVLHNFKSSDGQTPKAGLTKVKGTLYGTTSDGGANLCAPYRYSIYCGTVFSITPSGTENVLVSFGPGQRRANTPFGGVVDAGDKLYGVTYSGGKNDHGTIFSVTLSGKLKVLHHFSGPPDGAGPFAGLTEINGTLYGTTAYGGAHCGSQGPCGTVFSVTKTGAEKVLHSFSGTDGGFPSAALILVNGTLYGTTTEGGAHGGGTVFSITPSGKEKVLHSFSDYPHDGAQPFAELLDVSGTLYGTTYRGGAYGAGTVFALSP